MVCGGIDEDSLARHFKTELGQGRAKAQAKVGQSLFQKATSGEDTTAAIWYTKAQMRWRDTSKVELTGANGGPMQSEITLSPALQELVDAVTRRE
jgi:hypothetical protein